MTSRSPARPPVPNTGEPKAAEDQTPLLESNAIAQIQYSAGDTAVKSYPDVAISQSQVGGRLGKECLCFNRRVHNATIAGNVRGQRPQGSVGQSLQARLLKPRTWLRLSVRGGTGKGRISSQKNQTQPSHQREVKSELVLRF